VFVWGPRDRRYKVEKDLEGKFLPLTMAVKRKSTGPVPGQPKAKTVKSNGKAVNGKKSAMGKAQKVKKEIVVQDEEESDDDEFKGFGDDDGANWSDISMEDDLDMNDSEGEEEGEEEGEGEEDEDEKEEPKKKSDKPPKSGTHLNACRINFEEDEPSGHIAQRALAKERKMSRPNGSTRHSTQLIKADKLHEAKKLWESLRRSKQSKAERQAQVDELFNIITGDIPSLVFGHSASRFVQTAVKYGSPAQRMAIAEELKGRYIELAKSKYGKFLVVKILEYGYPTSLRVGLIVETRT
jgi:pumilio family protein 6